MSIIWGTLNSALETIATGQADPQDAMDDAVETVREQIEAIHSD